MMVTTSPQLFHNNKVRQVLVHNTAICMPRLYEVILTSQSFGLRMFSSQRIFRIQVYEILTVQYL